MATFLFGEIIFGPVSSRRLGVSLGINLLPLEKKFCNFNCVYCECGLTSDAKGVLRMLPTRAEVSRLLRESLQKHRAEGKNIDTITFAGNGEPTLHPDFCGIVDDTVLLRDELMPSAAISVLTNATLLDNAQIVEALAKVDLPMLKLDAGSEETYQAINQPLTDKSLATIASGLKALQKNIIVQSMFVRFSWKGKNYDNTLPSEISPWLLLLKQVNPKKVILYSIARDTAIGDVEAVCSDELELIAARVRALGLPAEVY